MKYFNVLFLFLFINTASAGEIISPTTLAGSWKMTDAKVTKQGKTTTPKIKDDCYLCDIYLTQSGLVFSENGKVNYSNFGNPNDVNFEVNGNVISFYTFNPDEQKSGRTSVEFSVSVKNNVLTLTRVSPEVVETYTLTK